MGIPEAKKEIDFTRHLVRWWSWSSSSALGEVMMAWVRQSGIFLAWWFMTPMSFSRRWLWSRMLWMHRWHSWSSSLISTVSISSIMSSSASSILFSTHISFSVSFLASILFSTCIFCSVSVPASILFSTHFSCSVSVPASSSSFPTPLVSASIPVPVSSSLPTSITSSLINPIITSSRHLPPTPPSLAFLEMQCYGWLPNSEENKETLPSHVCST